MEYGTIPGIDKPVSRVVQGTVMLGDPDRDPAANLALLDAVYDLGGTAFDTARHYGGDSEATFGRWLRERGVRDRIVVIGKGAHYGPEGDRVTPADIAADLATSLARLGVSAIDLYLLHRDDPKQPVGPIVEALNAHHRAGTVRAFGGSNWSHERIAAANAYAADHGLVGFVASSPNFTLAEQAAEPWPGCVSIGGAAGRAARAWYRETQMPIVAWSSLAGGFFSGRYARDNYRSIPGAAADRCRAVYCTPDNFERLERAQHVATERGLTLPQVALAYVLSQPLNVFAIVGCETGEEFAANAAASHVRLSPEELAWLNLERDER